MSPPHAPPHARTRMPRGESIVEALVATLLLTVGVLAMVGLGTVLARDERRGASRRRAAAMVAETSAAWAAAPCAEAEGGRTIDGLVERWRATVTGDSLAVLVDSVSTPADSAIGGAALITARGCAR